MSEKKQDQPNNEQEKQDSAKEQTGKSGQEEQGSAKEQEKKTEPEEKEETPEEKAKREEQEKQEAEAKEQAARDKEEMQFFFKRWMRSFFRWAVYVLNIREGVDVEGTMDDIKKNIEYRGAKVWILMCSIIIASIGLNVNSTAVVIGAMLISPLMGPIMGMGMSLGTNDWQTLLKSLKNFGIMVGVALITSTIYFLVSPLEEVQLELYNRTRPHFLDVLVAIFGGLAGIIATSRRDVTTVIPGVAIATALMPPLCTAGFGIANGEWMFFLGAVYLFAINSIFISMTTFAVTRFLKFPKARFVGQGVERRIRWYIGIFIFILVIPSGIIFFYVMRESSFRSNADTFLTREMRFTGTKMIESEVFYEQKQPVIEVFLIGEILPESRIWELQARLPDYKLEKAELRIYQAVDPTGKIRAELLEELEKGLKDAEADFFRDVYKDRENELAQKQQLIDSLKNMIASLQVPQVDMEQLKREVEYDYPEVAQVEYMMAVSIAEQTAEKTVAPTFLVRWEAGTPDSTITSQHQAIEKWLKVRLNTDEVRIVKY